MRSRAVLTFFGVLAVLAGVFLGATAAMAHGERAQDGFARLETTGWWDTKFQGNDPTTVASPITVAQGDKVNITGTVKVLESWPNNLSNGNPDVCYLTAVEPGAQFIMVDKTVNGVQAPQSFFCHKGDVFNFTETLEARSPGSWHLHPALAVRGAGTIIGPGQWFTVNPGSNYSFTVPLLTGGTADLETVGFGLVVIMSIIGFALGMWWMIYWTWPYPTITRLAAANMLPLNQDGGDAVGLITKKDHRWSGIIALITAVFLVVAFGYQALAYPSKLPLQTDWFSPPVAKAPASLGTVVVKEGTAKYDVNAHVLTMTVTVDNTSNETVQVAALRMAYLTFFNSKAITLTPGDYIKELDVSGADSIAPGQTADVQLTVPANGNALDTEELLPIGKAQAQIAGIIQLTGSGGTQNYDEFVTPFIPSRV
jgi:methane/ammonia monooxygenase subunit B